MPQNDFDIFYWHKDYLGGQGNSKRHSDFTVNSLTNSGTYCRHFPDSSRSTLLLKNWKTAGAALSDPPQDIPSNLLDGSRPVSIRAKFRLESVSSAWAGICFKCSSERISQYSEGYIYGIEFYNKRKFIFIKGELSSKGITHNTFFNQSEFTDNWWHLRMDIFQVNEDIEKLDFFYKLNEEQDWIKDRTIVLSNTTRNKISWEDPKYNRIGFSGNYSSYVEDFDIRLGNVVSG